MAARIGDTGQVEALEFPGMRLAGRSSGLADWRGGFRGGQMRKFMDFGADLRPPGVASGSRAFDHPVENCQVGAQGAGDQMAHRTSM